MSKFKVEIAGYSSDANIYRVWMTRSDSAKEADYRIEVRDENRNGNIFDDPEEGFSVFIKSDDGRYADLAPEGSFTIKDKNELEDALSQFNKTTLSKKIMEAKQRLDLERWNDMRADAPVCGGGGRTATKYERTYPLFRERTTVYGEPKYVESFSDGNEAVEPGELEWEDVYQSYTEVLVRDYDYDGRVDTLRLKFKDMADPAAGLEIYLWADEFDGRGQCMSIDRARSGAMSYLKAFDDESLISKSPD